MSKKITSFVVLLAAMLLTLPSHAQSQLLTRSNGKSATEVRGGKNTLNVADLAKAKEAVAKAKEAELASNEANANGAGELAKWDWEAHAPEKFVPTNIMQNLAMGRKVAALSAKLNAVGKKDLRVNAQELTANANFSSLSGKKFTTIRKADGENASIEGTWTFNLGDYYFQTSTKGTITYNFEATLEGSQVWFEDPTGYELPFFAEYNDAAGTLTFSTAYLGTASGYYVYQEPYVYNYDTDDLDVQSIVGVYNASAGTITFQADNGISWPAYSDQAATDLAGYFGIYDLEGATYVGEAEPIDEEQAGQWTTVGMATFIDAWIMPSYSTGGVQINPNANAYEVELQQNVANENLYRLWKPYTNGNSIIAGQNQSVYQGQIVFDVTDPDHVVVKPGMPAGFKNSNGEFYVFGLLGWQIHMYGEEYDGSQLSSIISFMESDGQPFDTFKNGVVSVNKSVFDIDAACSKAYTWNNNNYVVSKIVFPGAELEEETATTGPNVDTLPYSQSLTTTASFADFGVLDVNTDGKTWSLAAGTGAQYTYSGTNAADDWLITPAIKLEAGKPYHFALDAATYSASYPEKFEVKMATVAKASALSEGAEIIPVTTVVSSSKEFYTFENGSFTVEETGYYHFGIHAVSAANMWTLYVKNVLVEEGPDPTAPAAVEAFTVTPLEDELGAVISFTAPTKAINGETLAANAITKIEILRDGAKINTIASPTPGAALTYTDQAEDLTIGNHKYQAIAYGETGIGGKSAEVTVFLSAILNVPTSFDLTKQDVFGTFQVIDANADGKTWSWDASYGTYYNYNSSLAADDYLISVGINLKKGSMYKVYLNAHSYSENYPETFEVLAGTAQTPEALTITAIPATTVASATDVEFEGEFVAPEDGVYNLAVHAISEANMWRLHVSRLAIEKGPEPTAPAMPTLTMEAGEKGALLAEGTVVMPTTSINGNALTGNIERVDILCDNELLTTFYNVAPGISKKIYDEPREGGVHTYQAIPYNEYGIGQKSEKVTIFVGPDAPAPITNVVVSSPEAGKLTFTWDPVVGEHGGYIDNENVTYTVVTLEEEVVLFWTVLVEGQTLGSVNNVTTATVDFNVDLGDPGFQYFGVKATVNGETSDPTVNYGYARTGAPELLPITESFEGQKMNHVWFTSNIGLYVSDESSDGDGVALALTPSLPQPSEFMTVKLDLKQTANPTILFDAKKGTSAVDEMEVFALTPDGVYTVLETVTLTDEYQSFKVIVPDDLKNVRWAHLGFKVNFEDTGNVIIDNIKMLDFYPYDLSIAVEAPKTLTAGNKAEVKATVKNEGENTITGYTVVVKAGEDVLLQQNVKDNLKSFETKEFVAEYESSIFDDAADVTVTATVTYANDLNPDNDEASAIFSIKEPAVPGVDNVSAWTNGDRVITYWTAPVIDAPIAEEVTESFESGDLGEWTVIDADGDGYEWRIAQIVDEDGNPVGGHTGDYTVISQSYVNNLGALTPDNWLVSPEAVLDGTFKFWAHGTDANYAAEHFQVYVSTTDPTDVATFEAVSQEFVATGEWTEYTVDLSAYAGVNGWIAIRHFNVTDEFQLEVDDITYLVGSGGVPEIDHFNIYLDGEYKTKANVNQSIATIENVGAGSHTVGVSVVYVNGQESKPVVASVDVATGLNQINVLTQPVDVYSLDGKLIRKQTTSFDGLKGVYVVDGKKVVLK